MRHYETIFIIHPDLGDEETAAVVDKFSGILSDGGAFLVKQDHWGRRRLAYAVKKQNKGYFVLLEYGAEAPAVAEMERNFKIDEQVIRFLTVKLSDSFDLEAMRARKAETEAKAAARAEAEAARAAEAAQEAESAPEQDQEEAEEQARPEASAAKEQPAEEQTEAAEAQDQG